MPRSLRSIIAKLPPIDWALIAQQRRDASRKTRKGQKRPLDEIEHMAKARRAKGQARAKEASQRVAAQLRAGRSKAPSALSRIVEAMPPGEWLARRDVTVLTGLAFNTICGCLASLERDGFVRRAANEARRPARYVKGRPVHLQVDAHAEPAILFSLTEKGVARREKARAAGAAMAIYLL